jgi:hypothetical protein
MADADGTLITLVGINLHREWTLDYVSNADRLKLRFSASRNEFSDIQKNPILPAGDYWIVPFSHWQLATAIYADPDVDVDALAIKVKDKIKAALLAWPLDDHMNTFQAKDVQIRPTVNETSAEVRFAVVNVRRQEKARRRKQLIRSLVAAVVVIFLWRWLRTL